MRNGRSVLVVDSGVDAAEPLARRIQQLGFGAVRAKTPEAALEALADRRWNFGALVLAPNIPVMDLERAVHAFRCAAGGGPLPLLASGRRPDAQDRSRLRAAGVERALWEPLDDHTLRFQLNRALSEDGARNAARGEERVPTNWPVLLRSSGREKPAKVYSLSSHGAYLATARPTLPRSLVWLSLPLPEADELISGEVVMTNVPGNLVRPNLPIGMGLRFLGLDRGISDAIAEWTRSRAEMLVV